MPKNLDVAESPGDDGKMYHIQQFFFWPAFISSNASSYVGHGPPPNCGGNLPFCAFKKSWIVAFCALDTASIPPLADGLALCSLAAARNNMSTALSIFPLARSNAFFASSSSYPISISFWTFGETSGPGGCGGINCNGIIKPASLNTLNSCGGTLDDGALNAALDAALGAALVPAALGAALGALTAALGALTAALDGVIDRQYK
jgi:hypothetical protein